MAKKNYKVYKGIHEKKLSLPFKWTVSLCLAGNKESKGQNSAVGSLGTAITVDNFV
jgi:hypothetical protein